MPKVWNKRDKNIPVDAVYCGRPSKWGNPYTIGRDGNRDQVIRLFRENININLVNAAQKELRGRDLICFCAPLPCHLDVLISIANCDSPLGDICHNICGICDDCYENEQVNIANERM